MVCLCRLLVVELIERYGRKERLQEARWHR